VGWADEKNNAGLDSLQKNYHVNCGPATTSFAMSTAPKHRAVSRPTIGRALRDLQGQGLKLTLRLVVRESCGAYLP
jgi:hypothetical protein